MRGSETPWTPAVPAAHGRPQPGSRGSPADFKKLSYLSPPRTNQIRLSEGMRQQRWKDRRRAMSMPRGRQRTRKRREGFLQELEPGKQAEGNHRLLGLCAAGTWDPQALPRSEAQAKAWKVALPTRPPTEDAQSRLAGSDWRVARSSPQLSILSLKPGIVY